MAPEVLIRNLIRENQELARILSASIKTARAKGLQKPNEKGEWTIKK
jgi:hypothetical protein